LQRDYLPWDLYTILTHGDATPYRIAAHHNQFSYDSPEICAFYSVETGNSSPSPFCLQRNGAIQYNSHSVDYANSELIYSLSLLNPLFPYHEIKGTLYFEGTGNKTHELLINGVKKLTLTVEPNQACDFEIPIPSELYKESHRVTFSIRNPANSGVYLAKLKVYRLIDGKMGGPQSAFSSGLQSQNHLVLTPNPFNKNLDIRYQMPDKSQRISLKIYDATGRLAKTFNLPSNIGNLSSISWDGTDDTGIRLPNGIYFLELKSGDESMTEKVIMLR